ncbi:hypothetical protein BH11PSE10_BH11PSE10_13690 [soil metagenome]
MRTVTLALALALALGLSVAARADPNLFSAKPLDFERPSAAKVVGVYVPNWEPVALIDAIKPGSVSHLLYAFLRICGPGQLPRDATHCAGKADFELASGPQEQTFDAAFLRLKQRAPHVKVVASVGGWGGSDPFFHLANDAARRAVFAASAVKFLRDHPGFDGIDIDWEHPGGNGSALDPTTGVPLGSAADGQAYADLVMALRRAVDPLGLETGRRYLVTTAVNGARSVVSRVNYRAAEPALDLVFLMTYDFYGGWSKVGGHHTALFSSAAQADDSVDEQVRNMRTAGLPAAKLVVGVAMYGRGFSGLAKPAAGTPKTGDYPPAAEAVAGEAGTITYKALARQFLQGQRGFQTQFDASSQAWYLWRATDGVYIGYDDPRAVLLKGAYVREKGLAGLFAWELSQDNGDILNAMNRGLGMVPKIKPMP